MTKSRRLFRLAVVAACLAGPTFVAAAQTTAPAAGQVDAPTTPALSAQQLSLQGFGAHMETCLEWGDSCSICQRDEAGAMKCSTPGIACQPEEIVCRREKAK